MLRLLLMMMVVIVVVDVSGERWLFHDCVIFGIAQDWPTLGQVNRFGHRFW